MDAVTQAVIIIGCIAATPAVLRTAARLTMKFINHRKKEKKRKERYRMSHDKEYQKRMLKKRGFVKDLENKNSMRFTNPKTGLSKEIAVEYANDLGITDQVVLRGTLRCKCTDGVVRAETVYLLQPTFKTLASGAIIKPAMTKSGHITKGNPYRVNIGGETYETYAPRRELASGINFDFVRGSKFHQDPSIKNYFDIELETDQNGNYIPVDLTNPEELKRIKEYIDKKKSYKVGPEGYFLNIYDEALEAREKFNVRAEPFDITQITGEPAKTESKDDKSQERVEKTDYGYDYYDRYNYHRPGWMGERGSDYAYNFDMSDHVLGGDGHYQHNGGPGRRR